MKKQKNLLLQANNALQNVFRQAKEEKLPPNKGRLEDDPLPCVKLKSKAWRSKGHFHSISRELDASPFGSRTRV